MNLLGPNWRILKHWQRPSRVGSQVQQTRRALLQRAMGQWLIQQHKWLHLFFRFWVVQQHWDCLIPMRGKWGEVAAPPDNGKYITPHDLSLRIIREREEGSGDGKRTAGTIVSSNRWWWPELGGWFVWAGGGSITDILERFRGLEWQCRRWRGHRESHGGMQMVGRVKGDRSAMHEMGVEVWGRGRRSVECATWSRVNRILQPNKFHFFKSLLPVIFLFLEYFLSKHNFSHNLYLSLLSVTYHYNFPL
jgi:hypothetical protein